MKVKTVKMALVFLFAIIFLKPETHGDEMIRKNVTAKEVIDLINKQDSLIEKVDSIQKEIKTQQFLINTYMKK